MDFTDALPLLRDGKRVTRRLWRELDGRVGSWLELVDDPLFARPVLLVWYEDDQGFTPWSGAQNDVLADDWEIA
jgi:hypothetical protein